MQIPLFVLIATLIGDWIERRAVPVDLDEVTDLVLPRVAWGPLRRNGRCVGRYCMIALPSYDWRLNLCRLEFQWHQRVLVKRTGHPWRTWYRPV